MKMVLKGQGHMYKYRQLVQRHMLLVSTVAVDNMPAVQDRLVVRILMVEGRFVLHMLFVGTAFEGTAFEGTAHMILVVYHIAAVQASVGQHTLVQIP